jgi:polysaccharide pyruvyl transferase WcaK-like protein
MKKARKLNIAIYGANPYNGNKGVAALAYSTLFVINNILIDKNYDINYYLLHSDKFTNKKDKIVLNDSEIIFTNVEPINIGSLRSFVRFCISPKQWRSIKDYLQFDCILNIGGGDSFSDIYGTTRFKSINSQNIIARLLGKKYILLPQTIGPFKSKVVKKKAFKSINNASVVMPRDTKSLTYIRENSNSNEYHETMDLAFFMPYRKEKSENQFINVGLNVSALCWHGGYTRDNQFGLKVDYKKLTREIISRFLSNDKVNLFLVPHVVHEKYHIENDYHTSYKLIEEINHPRLKISPFFLNPIYAKNFISSLDFFVGARMHSTIAAYSSEVAVFPLAYSRKFNGLFEDTLNYSYLGDMKEESESEIIAKMEDAFENRSDLKLLIKKNLENVVLKRKEIIDSILTSFFMNLKN